MLTFCICLDLKRSLTRNYARSETLLFASNGFCGEPQPFSLLSNIVVNKLLEIDATCQHKSYHLNLTMAAQCIHNKPRQSVLDNIK